MHLRYFNFNKGISLEDFENKINLSIIFATLSYCHTESMEISLKNNPNILPREIILPLNLNYTKLRKLQQLEIQMEFNRAHPSDSTCQAETTLKILGKATFLLAVASHANVITP